MRLMMFEKGKDTALGLVDGKSVIDLAAADAALPKSLEALIAAGSGALGAVKAAAAKAPASANGARVRETGTAGRAVAQDHLRRSQLCSARQGGWARHSDLSLVLPARADLIGRGRCTGDPAEVLDPARLRVRAHHRDRQERSAHPRRRRRWSTCFGYTLFNDVSVRDCQRKTSQWTPGKNFDGTGRLALGSSRPTSCRRAPAGLRIMTRVNGETMQDSNTSDLIFPTAAYDRAASRSS